MPDELFKKLKPHKKEAVLLGAILFVLNGYLWSNLLFAGGTNLLRVYFLPVGQGDSELVLLPGGAKMLIDGGPANGHALEELGKILGPTDRRIDVIVLSHPQVDHYGGLVEVARYYDVGAFLWNGDGAESVGFRELLGVLTDRHVPLLKMSYGDHICFLESCGDVVWPRAKGAVDNMNERSLVLALRSAGATVLFTGDLGRAAERAFLSVFHEDINVLKVGHHGSDYSTSREFLNVLKPEIAVIEVGKNSYGHPSPDTLSRLSESGTRILRSDDAMRWSIEANGEQMKIFSGTW